MSKPKERSAYIFFKTFVMHQTELGSVTTRLAYARKNWKRADDPTKKIFLTIMRSERKKIRATGRALNINEILELYYYLKDKSVPIDPKGNFKFV